MAMRRRRYTADGEPAICTVEIPSVIARIIYRETRSRGFGSETELVNSILRKWTEDQEQMSERQWKKLLAEFQAEDARDEEKKRKAA